MKKINESKNSKKFNYTISKVHEEMEYAKDVISNWNVKWDEVLSKAYCYDLQFLTEDEIAWLESIYDNRYDLTNGGDEMQKSGAALARETLVDDSNEEYVCEFRKVTWNLINPKLVRMFNFVNDGDIEYSQVKRKRRDDDESYDYYTKYNVNDNSLALRFVKNNDDLNVYYDGSKRVISSDNVVLSENHNGMELLFCNEEDKLIVNIDELEQIDSKVLISSDEVFVICGDEVVKATRKQNSEEVEIEVDDELVEKVTEKLNNLEFANYTRDELLMVVSNMKMRLIMAIKSVKNDVPLSGLMRRFDILQSMINTKCRSSQEVNEKSKAKKIR